VRPDGITEITVRAGQAEIFGPRGSEILAQGQTMEARGSADDPEFQIVAAIPMDDFDRFNLDRDRVMQQTSSYRPGALPQDVTGGESLDPYGQWQNDPNYGQVWVPNEPAGWAPYQNGRWVDEDYYGWTWISGDPWGWAPYHYGYWYTGPFGWAWWPGPVGPHYWRPAMVGFFGWGVPGFGVGIGFGFGFGHVGWVPLAPFEAFHPWYGPGAGAFGRAGVANIGVANAFRNARVNGAISSMRATDFGHAGVSAAGMVRPNATELARASAIRGSLAGIPATSASRRVSDAAVNSRGVPQTSANTRFYSRGTAGATAARSGASTSAGTASQWRSLNGNTPSAAGRGPTAATPQSNYRYNNVPQGAAQAGAQGPARSGGYATPPQNRAPAQQPLRMNPQIVQQRSAPAAPAPSRSSGGSAPSRGGGGGGGHGGGGHR